MPEVKIIAQLDNADMGIVLMRCGMGIYRLEETDGVFELTRLDRSSDPYTFGDALLSLAVGSLSEALSIAKDFVAEVESKA